MSGSSPTIENFPKPKFITGGCLCGSIKYRADFPEDHDFLHQASEIDVACRLPMYLAYHPYFDFQSRSCQCTQCRRGTGCLFYVAHTVPLGNFTYLTPTTTLKNFYATPGIQRGFCSNCGSFLYWRHESRDEIAMAVGTVDPEFLSDFGFALANTAGDNVWCENEIKGVTDGMIGKERGIKWATDSKGVRM